MGLFDGPDQTVDLFFGPHRSRRSMFWCQSTQSVHGPGRSKNMDHDPRFIRGCAKIQIDTHTTHDTCKFYTQIDTDTHTRFRGTPTHTTHTTHITHAHTHIHKHHTRIHSWHTHAHTLDTPTHTHTYTHALTRTHIYTRTHTTHARTC